MPKKLEIVVDEKKENNQIDSVKKGKATAKKESKIEIGKGKAKIKKINEKNKASKVKRYSTAKNYRKNNPNNPNKIVRKKINKDKKVEKEPKFLQEYYDLPYRYNETVVTILAQTPKRIFVYWDVSDNDRNNFIKVFGDDFFDKTYPVLLVHNEELNYTFEVPINDFANSWYLDIKDSKNNYVIQLGRKFRNIETTKNINYDYARQENINLQNDFIYITDSNKIEVPNDHILFELLTSKIKFRNVKTGEEYYKNLEDIFGNLRKMYPEDIVQELYTKLYANELIREDFGRRNPGSSELGLQLPSGALSSSKLW